MMNKIYGLLVICVVFLTPLFALAQHDQHHKMQSEMLFNDDLKMLQANLESSLKQNEEQYGPNSEMAQSSLSALASLYQLQGNFVAAEAAYVRLITVVESQGDGTEATERHLKFRTENYLQHLAETYEQRNKLVDAEKTYLRALQFAERRVPDDLAAGDILSRLGRLYVRQGKLSEAERRFKRALAAAEKSAVGIPAFIQLIDLADLYFVQGRFNEARPFYVRAVEICERMKGCAPEERLYENAAKTYSMTGHMKESQELLTRTAIKRGASPPVSSQESSVR
jgi:tetratricopeptide (TPR) repeat protein